MFQCYQTSLIDQFIFIQQAWVNDEDFSNDGDGKDAVIGHDTDVSIHPNGQQATVQVHQWVTTEGAVLALTPSIPTLALLTSGQDLPLTVI